LESLEPVKRWRWEFEVLKLWQTLEAQVMERNRQKRWLEPVQRMLKVERPLLWANLYPAFLQRRRQWTENSADLQASLPEDFRCASDSMLQEIR
jgi:hypothetical protein